MKNPYGVIKVEGKRYWFCKPCQRDVEITKHSIRCPKCGKTQRQKK